MTAILLMSMIKICTSVPVTGYEFHSGGSNYIKVRFGGRYLVFMPFYSETRGYFQRQKVIQKIMVKEIRISDHSLGRYPGYLSNIRYNCSFLALLKIVRRIKKTDLDVNASIMSKTEKRFNDLKHIAESLELDQMKKRPAQHCLIASMFPKTAMQKFNPPI